MSPDSRTGYNTTLEARGNAEIRSELIHAEIPTQDKAEVQLDDSHSSHVNLIVGFTPAETTADARISTLVALSAEQAETLSEMLAVAAENAKENRRKSHE
jgi:hypothetical protein